MELHEALHARSSARASGAPPRPGRTSIDDLLVPSKPSWPGLATCPAFPAMGRR